jgi:NADPH:quinone reductase-like Zn-dependent oxidoreductase
MEAATLPVAAVTAWHSLNVVGRLKAGDTIVVQGSGGVSMFAIQFAKAAGARVISVLRSDRTRQAVLDAGAQDVVVAGPEDWPQSVMSLTGRRGADVVVDIAGAATLKASIASTAVGGCVHLIGYASGLSANIDIFEAIRHAVTITMGRGGHRTSFEAMIRAVSANSIRPVIDTVFPWSETPRAFDRLAAGGLAGKVVLDLSPPV